MCSFKLRLLGINPPACTRPRQALTGDRALIYVWVPVAAPGGGLQPGPAAGLRGARCLEGGMQSTDKGPGRNHPLRHGSDCELKELSDWEDQRSVAIIRVLLTRRAVRSGLHHIVRIPGFRGEVSGGNWEEVVTVVTGACPELLRVWPSHGSLSESRWRKLCFLPWVVPLF